MSERRDASTLPERVLLEDRECPLECSAGDDLVVIGCDRLHGIPGEFRVVRCRACGLMRTNPRPTPETIGVYYPGDYGPHAARPEMPGGESGGEPFWKPMLRAVIQFNTVRIPRISPGRMLEIGCATGAYLQRMASCGWDARGIEFSEQAAAVARNAGFEVRVGQVEHVEPFDGPFDLVVGWMVLEHLHDPIRALQRIRGWLKPGGYFVFSLPNAASLSFRLFGNAWYALQLPTHLYHFTPSTLKRVLHRAGWQAERIFPQRVLNEWFASFGYWLADRGGGDGLSEALLRYGEGGKRTDIISFPLAWLLSVFGESGRMTVWARKVDD